MHGALMLEEEVLRSYPCRNRGRPESWADQCPATGGRSAAWIAKRLKSMIWHERVVLSPPEGSVEVAYGEAEAEALLEKLAKTSTRKRRSWC